MCIAAFVWQSHPRYPLLLLLNRDEYRNRGTYPLQWWEDNGAILGGRDAVAEGTWLALTNLGKLAFITNVREVQRLEQCKSRGDLSVRFLSGFNRCIQIHVDDVTWFGALLTLQSGDILMVTLKDLFLNLDDVMRCNNRGSYVVKLLTHCSDERDLGWLNKFLWLQGKKSPMEFAEEVVEEVDQYNGFNLILADLHSKTMVYVTNRPKEEKKFITEVSPGIHVLTNDAMLDSPWPKSQRLGNSFKVMLNKSGDDEVSLKEMALELMSNTIRDDKSLLPRIYSPEVEYELSSIYIENAPQLGDYGTRSLDAVSVNTSGEVTFYERYMAANEWHERTESFQIKARGDEDEVNSEHMVQ